MYGSASSIANISLLLWIVLQSGFNCNADLNTASTVYYHHDFYETYGIKVDEAPALETTILPNFDYIISRC